jgi:hypothetical protein
VYPEDLHPPLTEPEQAKFDQLTRACAHYRLNVFWQGFAHSWRFSAQATELDAHPSAVVTDSVDELAAALGQAA